jgi:hypothetical protein
MKTQIPVPRRLGDRSGTSLLELKRLHKATFTFSRNFSTVFTLSSSA